MPAAAKASSGVPHDALVRRTGVVLPSPGVPAHHPVFELAARARVPVWSEFELAARWSDLPVVAITGTNGKTTVTTLVTDMLARTGRRVAAAGNTDVPLVDVLDEALDIVVVEASSFRLALTESFRPAVAAWLNVAEDHLDWHGSVERYHADKLSLTTQPEARCTVIAASPELLERRAQLGGEVVVAPPGDGALAEALGLVGRHGASNAAVAVAALSAAGVEGADDPVRVRAAADGYHPLPGRFREIACRDGVRYVDDSLATNPLPTIAALEALGDDRVALLLGGHDRGVSYEALVATIGARRGPTLVVTLPDNGPALGERVAMTTRVEVVDAADVAEAVALARRWLRGDGVVLLSPAAPSFSQFRDWKERSEAFAAAVADATG